MSRFTHFAGPAVAALFTLTAFAGCGGDRNIGQLPVGIARDSVLKILGQGSTATDSTPNVYREERYLNNGHFITLLMYSPTGKKEGVETIPEEQLIPVVLRDDTLTGWGWEHTDSVATANNIVLKPRAK
jgi:hypothetical protein